MNTCCIQSIYLTRIPHLCIFCYLKLSQHLLNCSFRSWICFYVSLHFILDCTRMVFGEIFWINCIISTLCWAYFSYPEHNFYSFLFSDFVIIACSLYFLLNLSITSFVYFGMSCVQRFLFPQGQWMLMLWMVRTEISWVHWYFIWIVGARIFSPHPEFMIIACLV